MAVTPVDLVGPRRWARVHRRAFAHGGSIVDIGCEGWAWSRQFFGRKPVYGYGPLLTETIPDGATAFRAAVGPVDGEVVLYGTNQEATGEPGIFSGAIRCPMVGIANVIERHKPISVLKLNIERMEYSLLAMCRHPVADQLAVSFHDRRREDKWRNVWTEAFLEILNRWYEPIKIHGQWGWWLLLAR